MRLLLCIVVLAMAACDKQPRTTVTIVRNDSAMVYALSDADLADTPGVATGVATGNTQPDELVAFARTLKGIPYRYASADPGKGFDCSGFVSYVFTHFGIEVPRSSVEFTHLGREISLDEATTGDLILFTGTDNGSSVVGHMGIVATTAKDTVLSFVHATSGSEYAVTETPLNEYYLGRYVKTIRIFRQNDRE